GSLLAHASVLTATTPGDETSLVQRGVFVGDRFACDPPGGARPDQIPPLDTGLDPVDALLMHSSSPACAGCHVHIDPYGIVLEAYDPVGRHRPDEVSPRVAEGADLPDGSHVSDLLDLATWLHADARFTTCVAEHLL